MSVVSDECGTRQLLKARLVGSRLLRAPRNFTRRLDDWLAAVEEDELEIEVALNATQHVVADDVAVAEVEERLLLGTDHRRANAPILHGAAVVELARIV